MKPSPFLVCWIALGICWGVSRADDGVSNVVSFGAKSDGETDDTAAVQKAIDAVGPTGGTVLFPPGTYRITHRNLLLDAQRNILTTDYGLTGNTFLGGRIIQGESPPTSQTHGLLGDVFEVRGVKPAESGRWRCLKSGHGGGAEWKLVEESSP